MARKLAVNIAARNPVTGEAVGLMAGDDVPEWASDLVHEDDLQPEPKPARRKSE